MNDRVHKKNRGWFFELVRGGGEWADKTFAQGRSVFRFRRAKLKNFVFGIKKNGHNKSNKPLLTQRPRQATSGRKYRQWTEGQRDKGDVGRWMGLQRSMLKTSQQMGGIKQAWGAGERLATGDRLATGERLADTGLFGEMFEDDRTFNFKLDP